MPSSDDELIAVVGAFQAFNRNASALAQAYQRLENAAVGVVQEIEGPNSEWRERLTLLTQRNHCLEELLNAMTCGVIAVDLEGRILYSNRAAEELTGFTAAELCGQNYHETLAGELGDKAPLMRALLSGESISGVVRELPQAQGSLSVRCSVRWMTSANGERTGVVEVIEDLSQYQEQERRLLQQKTLAALGDMAEQVAHELRNPMAGIKGFAGLLAQDLPAESHSHNMAKRIIEGVNAIDRIASNLVILTRETSGELVRQPLEPIFKQAISDLNSAGSGAAVRCDFPATPCPAKVDAEKMKQLLSHLLKNAAEAHEDGEIIAGYRTNALNNEAHLFVRDFGTGIDEQIQDRLFSPFFSTKPRNAGLGLAIAKRIAEIHRGRIEFSNQPEGGAQFTVVLPII